jgi:hypothetical protein
MLRRVSQLAERYIRRHTGLGDAFTDNWGAARAAAAGVAYQHTEYPVGAPGVKRSLTEMARLMREARLDPAIGGYCADVLKAAGIDGRNRAGWTARAVTQALLDNVRTTVIYAPDAVAAEVITSPAGQLCLRPNLCIRKEDCDGLTTLLGAMVMSVGFRAWIVKQSWGPSAQEHVLLAVEDEDGNKLLADPSHASLPVGRGVAAHSQEYFDPLDADCAVNVGAGNAELVTFGAIPTGLAAHGSGGGHGRGGGGAQRPMHGGDGSMRRYQNGRWVTWNGMSWVPSGNIGCLQWGTPLAKPSAALRAYANSIGADNMPIITTYGGTEYLFAIKNGALVIRPCVGTVGMGAAAVNEQLAPRGARPRTTGVGASYSADQIRAQLLEVSGVMDQAEAAIASADAAGCLPQSSVLQFRLFYASWVTTRDALSACLADTLPSVDTSCSPFYSFPGDWSQAQATLTGYMNAVQGTGKPPTGGWQQTIASACSWYQPPPQHETPITPPAPSPGDLLDKAKSTAMVVGGVIAVAVIGYTVFEVVSVGSAIAKRA